MLASKCALQIVSALVSLSTPTTTTSANQKAQPVLFQKGLAQDRTASGPKPRARRPTMRLTAKTALPV
jgi:hypothetical protein